MLLRERPGWQLHDGALRRQFAFGGFSEAFAFMTEVARIVAAADHCIDWSNAWRFVTIDLRTPECAGVSEQDLAMADAINRLYLEWGAYGGDGVLFAREQAEEAAD